VYTFSGKKSAEISLGRASDRFPTFVNRFGVVGGRKSAHICRVSGSVLCELCAKFLNVMAAVAAAAKACGLLAIVLAFDRLHILTNRRDDYLPNDA